MSNISEIVLEKVQERFEELGTGEKTGKYLDVTDEAMKQAVNNFVTELESLGYEARDGPYGPEVFDYFQLNFDVMEEMLEDVISRNLEKSAEEFSFDELFSNPVDMLERSRKAIPRDTAKWTVDYLDRCGFEEVSLDTWIRADLLMKWNFKAKMNEKMSGQMQQMKNLLPF